MPATAIAIAASTTATMVAIEQERQHEQQCAAWMPSYSDLQATVEQKQAYADCVETLYPQAATGLEAVAIKVAIVAAFLGAGVGAWWAARDDGWEMGILGALMGALVAPCAFGIAIGAWFGLKYVFS